MKNNLKKSSSQKEDVGLSVQDIDTSKFLENVDVKYINGCQSIDNETNRSIDNAINEYCNDLRKQIKPKLESLVTQNISDIVSDCNRLNEKRKKLEKRERRLISIRGTTDFTPALRLELIQVKHELDEVVDELMGKYNEGLKVDFNAEEVVGLRRNVLNMRDNFIEDIDDYIEVIKAQEVLLRIIRGSYYYSPLETFDRVVSGLLGVNINGSILNELTGSNKKALIELLVKF